MKSDNFKQYITTSRPNDQLNKSSLQSDTCWTIGLPTQVVLFDLFRLSTFGRNPI